MMLLRWVEMKSGLVIEEYMDLETHLNLITDFTGSSPRMFSTMSYGIWLIFLCRRIGGSLISDILEIIEVQIRQSETLNASFWGIWGLRKKMELIINATEFYYFLLFTF